MRCAGDSASSEFVVRDIDTFQSERIGFVILEASEFMEALRVW